MNAVILPEFPLSRLQPFTRTSDPTPQYNCIAWAFGDMTKRYWPATKFFYWPTGMRNDNVLEAFVELFSSQGYSGDVGDSLEVGFTKVAIFCKNGLPTHAARQLSSGLWTSKLGIEIDVAHSLASMESGFYGDVVRIMKVPTQKLPPIIFPLLP